MTEKKRFFKTRIVIEVLAEGEAWDGDLSTLADDVTDGAYSGQVVSQEVTELTQAQVAVALVAQGSDPDFLIGYDGLGDEDFLNPIHIGDEVEYDGEIYIVGFSPDRGEDENPDATGEDILTIRKAGDDSCHYTEVFRKEVR